MSILNRILEELSPGDILQGRYTIVRKVGGGGMGIVYEANDGRMAGRQVAIKEMRQANFSSEQLAKIKKQFEREANILNLLHHPNLPRVYDSFEENGRYYLVMEFIEGETLLQQLGRTYGHPLPVHLVVHYALQLCDVLTYLHKRLPPVIFRDLKPSNVMITPDGRVFLIDFGIARHFKHGQRGNTEAFGTKGYIAPEVGFAQTDARSDVYSLGATLHHCLTCQLPDYADQHFQFPPILNFNGSVPRELDRLILEMVEYNPKDRPKSAAQVKKRLERIAQQVGQAGGQSGRVQDRPLLYTSTYAAGTYNDPFYSAPTHDGNFYNAPTASGVVTEFIQPVQPPLTQFGGWVQFTAVPLLVKGFGYVKEAVTAILLYIFMVVWRVLALCLAPEFRQDLYDRYLQIRVKLNATGVWTPRFLLLLTGVLLGTLVLAITLYSHFGSSYYRVELGLAFVLLVSIIVVAGFLMNPVPRNIVLCAGFFMAVMFLTLLASLSVQQSTNGLQHPLTFNQLFIYGLGTMALIALLGRVVTPEITPPYQVARPTHWFTRLSHLVVVGIAGISLLLQYSFGNEERVVFLPSMAGASPATTYLFFGIPVVDVVTVNDVVLGVLAAIGFFSLLRLMSPFTRFDRVMVLVLCLVYLPLQYTFGIDELRQVFGGANTTFFVTLNLVFLVVPLVLVCVALLRWPDQFEWIGQLALFFLVCAIGCLQNFLGEREPLVLFSSHMGQTLTDMSGLAVLGQLLLYALGMAVALLLLRVVFFRMVKSCNAIDRIAILLVTVGCGLISWAFWQREGFEIPALSGTEQRTNLLYGSILSQAVGYTLMIVVVLATAIAAANSLFRLPLQFSWLKRVEQVMDRVTVLGIVVLILLLLGFFGNSVPFLALSFNLRDMSSSAPDMTLNYNQVLMLLLALFGLIALLRLRCDIGWIERVVMLLSGATAILMLTGTSNVQGLPLLSMNMQQVTGSIFSGLTVLPIVATCMLEAALLSLLWLMRSKVVLDRVVLGVAFGSAALCGLVQYISLQHALLLVGLILLMQGTLIGAQIERVRRGNTPY